MENANKLREEDKVEKETKFEGTEGIETSEIEKLTDDCLIEVFQHLTTIADKIRIERVCKRWQRVSQKSWNNFKSLDFSAKTWGLDENGSDDQLSIRSIDFDKIIRLSGRYLTRISADFITFGKMCHLLSNIRELHLFHDWREDCLPSRVDTTSQVVISWLLSHGKNIRLFHMELLATYFKEEDFVRVLRETKQLETLHFYNVMDSPDWSGICLLELPFDIIEDISLLTNRDIFDHNILSMMLKKCKKLQTFCLEKRKVDGIWEALSSQADTLKNLKLQFDHINHQSVLSTMSALIHLEKLDTNYYVTDAFLEVVSKNCKKLTYLNLMYSHKITDAGISSICNLKRLTYLNLSRCHEITDAGISSICNLEELTYLNIGALSKIRNPPLERLTSLIVLDASWNYHIQEECLCSFLRNAPQLRALSVEGCRSFTNELLNAAAEAAKIRNSNDKLDLYVDDTSINPEIVGGIPPFVNILKWDVFPVANYGVETPLPDRDYSRVFIAYPKINSVFLQT